MTLFKKVFQNQARPATEEEALEEEALRSNFMDAPDASGPLVLDPFEHALERREHSEEEVDPGEDDLHDEDDLAALKDAFAQDPFEAEGDVAAMMHEPVNEELTSDAFDPADGPGQTDDEIVACLGRALAAKTPEVEEEDRPELTEDADPGAGDEAAATGSHDAAEFAAETFASAEEAAEEEVAAEDLNIAAFAKEQMAALADGPANAPAEVDAEEDAADEPVLDLSRRAGLDVLPAPATGRAGRRAGRVKTRLLGFNRTPTDENDPFEQAPDATATAQREKFPVGWLVIVEGPGMGHSFSIFAGASVIGRGEDQVIRLDFGDNSISRNNHAAIAYDEEQNKFYIGHGGKSNIIRRNARPVLSTEELHHADLIRIGETTLRFVALCGSDFQWNMAGGPDAAGL
ncbi:FHA domain-containing protein [Roseobacter weihaiensis]|uniref:FHA domain-containing protein n=1 Tax=Roseobacter weihaiensis TaxID=2763262 RepID=UPI001D0A2887|nr:FHA domain-containing protein [Roseobacter sp. H9]